MDAQSKRFAQREREQSERMVFGVASEEDTWFAAICDLLSYLEPQDLQVEVARASDVLHKQVDGSVLDDLERSRQQNAVHVMHTGQLHRSVAGVDWHVGRRQRFLDLVELGLDRQVHFLPHGTSVLGRLRLAIPADLLDTVVQLVRVAIWIVEVGRPV